MDIKKIQQVLDDAKNSEFAKLTQQKLNVAIGNKEKALDEEFRKKQREGSQSEEAKKKRSQSQKAFNKTEKGKLVREQQVKKMKSSETWLTNVRSNLNKLHQDPEFQQQHAERNRQKLKDFYSTEKGKLQLKKTAELVSRAIVTPYGEFKSIKEYERSGYKSFNDRRKHSPHLYYYKEEKPGQPTYEKVLHSPYGSYGSKGSKSILFLRALENNDDEAIKAGNAFGWWSKMSRNYPDQYYETREIRREWDLEP